MSVSMALVDFIPVILFVFSAIILQKDLHNKMSPVCFGVFAGGSVMVAAGGAYKALWKLLYALGVCDFEKLNTSFLPMQATGFLLLAAALIAMFIAGKKKGTSLAAVAAAPAVYSGSMIFVAIMCFGVGALCASLSILAAKLKKKGLIALFVLCFVMMLSMGYLSSKDFAKPAMNWIAEGVNIVGQSLLLLGVSALHKAGLKDFEF